MTKIERVTKAGSVIYALEPVEHEHIYEDWSGKTVEELLIHMIKGEKPKIIGRVDDGK